jgi:hypothetical protein
MCVASQCFSHQVHVEKHLVATKKKISFDLGKGKEKK